MEHLNCKKPRKKRTLQIFRSHIFFHLCRYVGGAFTTCNGNINCSNIAMWNGKNWNLLGTPASNGVTAPSYPTVRSCFEKKKRDFQIENFRKKENFLFLKFGFCCFFITGQCSSFQWNPIVSTN